MSLQYAIKVSKDHANVTATWDVSVDMSNAEIIWAFTLTVNGKTLNTQCSGGTKVCKAADYATLAHPDVDALVSFVITTNRPDVRNASDVLRGAQAYDDVEFSSN
jgi:hypothetical protein